MSHSKLFGTKPVVANHLHIPKPASGEPTLLTWDDVRAAFHEFGHAPHTIFSEIRYPRPCGVPRDFAGVPVAGERGVRNYAIHYKTGEAMTATLLEKLNAADKFNQGYRTTEYVAAALLDQAWHQLKADEVPTDVLAFEPQALKKAGVAVDVVPPRYPSSYFSHVFSGGYSAAYYVHIWAEVLVTHTVGYRAMVLARRGTDDALKLFRAFTGCDPYIEPLLKRWGWTNRSKDA
jgi:peptidyl-dipeptidase Dcp